MHDAGKLLARVANGDKRAFEILFTIFQARFLAVAESVTGDASMAEDAVQEAFVRVLRFASSSDGRKDPNAWLFKICVNCARDELARRRRRTTHEYAPEALDWAQDLATPLAKMLEQEKREIVTAAIRSLAPDLRAVLTLRFTADLTYEQIAGVLDVPLGTVQSRLHAAMGKLKDAVHRRTSGAAGRTSSEAK